MTLHVCGWQCVCVRAQAQEVHCTCASGQHGHAGLESGVDCVTVSGWERGCALPVRGPGQGLGCKVAPDTWAVQQEGPSAASFESLCLPTSPH